MASAVLLWRERKRKTMYNQIIQSCHQDFQIRKMSCGVLRPNGKASRCEDRRKAYGKFWSPEEACVISVKSRILCAISGSSSQSRGSFNAWTREDFRERRFAAKSREFRERRFAASKVEVCLEGSCVHTHVTEIAHSARLIPRSTGSRRRLVAVNERRGKASRARRRPPTGASDSGWARKASYGARRRFDEA